MDEAHCTLSLARSYMDNLGTDFRRLSQIPLTDARVQEYIDLLLPMDENPTEIHQKNISRIREDLKVRYHDAPDLQHVGRNAYRFLCSVSDFATHSKPLRATAKYQENMFGKTIEGNPLIDRAYTIVQAAA